MPKDSNDFILGSRTKTERSESSTWDMDGEERRRMVRPRGLLLPVVPPGTLVGPDWEVGFPHDFLQWVKFS